MLVAPDAVHVWRGYKSPDKTFADFANFLGSVFVPACALLQPNAGLQAYIPSMPIQKNKPTTVPDQTALMFWTNQDTYYNGFKKVAVRAYTNLHGDAYGPGSKAEFPILFTNNIELEQPYFLIEKPADWMMGEIQHLILSPGLNQTQADFLNNIKQLAIMIQSEINSGIAGCLLCAGAEYAVIWLLNYKLKNNSIISNMQIWLNCYADKYILPATLWDDWPGIDLANENENGSCLNIQLQHTKK